MRAIVVRHYKTLLNASDRILGWGDAPRVEGWRADVNFVESRLREESIHFDAIYSSALERARQTAMFYARLNRIYIVHDSEQLNEVNYGSLYGKSKKWVAKHIPEHKKDPDYVYPEGESFRQMQQRSVSFLVSLAQSRPGQTLLFVVHAGVIRGLVSHFLGLDYAENLKRKISHRYIGQMEFEGVECKRYDELGQRSGFVRSGAVKLPSRCSTSAVARESESIGAGLYM
jgi:broad specificity phosphatase PhoE